jgi:hypothetical protein
VFYFNVCIYEICNIFVCTNLERGAWDSIVIKATRYKLEGPGIDSGIAGDFPMASDSSMCPGVDSASKNEYQVNPGGKDDRCVRLTTYNPCADVKKSGGLNLLKPCGPVQACNGTAFTNLEIPCNSRTNILRVETGAYVSNVLKHTTICSTVNTLL